MNSSSFTRAWLITSAILAVVIPPLILRAEPAELPQSLLVVSGMNVSERSRLNQMAREYLAMSEAERQQYRDLHASLARDREETGGRNQRTLDAYHAWLSTIPILRREELRQTTDPAQRAGRIAEILEEQRTSELRDLRNPFLQRAVEFGVVNLKPDELERIMLALEARVPFDPEQQERLESRTGIERYIEFFRILNERKIPFRELTEKITPEQLAEFLPEGRMRPVPPGEDPVQHQRGSLWGMLAFNLRKEFELEVRRRRMDDGDLRRVIDDWDAADQVALDELLELEPDEFRERVESMHAEEQFDLDFTPIAEAMPWRQGDRRPPPPRPGEGPPRRDRRGPGEPPSEGPPPGP
jgi:hypothetical protein